MTAHAVDVLVIGAGVAGAAVAESLVRRSDRSVAVLEAAAVPGLHSSGRSVAVFDPLYGDDTVRALSAASRPMLESGLDGTQESLLSPRELVLVATADQQATIDARYPAGTPGVARLGESEVRALFPALRSGAIASAALHLDGADLDVARLHEGLLSRARRAGAQVLLRHPVRSIRPAAGGGWVVEAGDETVRAATVVNAAGAWADEVAHLAGARPLGVTPLRRSVGVARSTEPASSRWAMLVDVDMRWYVKPDGGTFLLSPADATAVSPGDPRPDEEELARAIDAVNEATTLGVRSLTRAWAGLRTYARDERPVIGFDPVVPDFFWHAAFGGFGLQVAPASGAVAADLILGRPTDLPSAPYAPARLLEPA